MQRVWSDSAAALASHHFLVQARVLIDIPRTEPRVRKKRKDHSVLRDSNVANSFAEAFCEHMGSDNDDADTESAQQLNERMTQAFSFAADRVLPEVKLLPRRPWISSGTLALIEKRNAARERGAREEELELARQVRASVKSDRSQWLESSLATGEWAPIRQLRKGAVSKQGRLANLSGDIVDSDQRADTLAQYLAQVQWAVRPTTVAESTDSLGPTLPVSCEPIAEGEVLAVAAKLKRGKAAGVDGVPSEFWKSICTPDPLPAGGR